MSIFDQIKDRVEAAVGMDLDPMISQVTQFVNDPAHGGLTGLVEQFKQKGLAETVQSWVGTGSNLPVNAEQIQSVLGQHLPGLAARFGIDPQTAADGLAKVLPTIVDKLTPEGKLPAQ